MSGSIEESLPMQSNEFRVSTPVARVRLPDGGHKLVPSPKSNKDKQLESKNPRGKNGRSNKGDSKKSPTTSDDKRSSNNRGNKKKHEQQLTKKQEDGSEKSKSSDGALEEYLKQAQKIKADISKALDRQATVDLRLNNESKLKSLQESILELATQSDSDTTAEQQASSQPPEEKKEHSSGPDQFVDLISDHGRPEVKFNQAQEQKMKTAGVKTSPERPTTNPDPLDALLMSKLDSESKVVALSSSLQKDFKTIGASLPAQIVGPILRKLVQINETNRVLAQENARYCSENNKLILIKDKLHTLCRELQKSNNYIRIDSLSLIKQEQGKAKEQAAKIQSTLAGVMKLFDENQQRNVGLNKENLELQNKLRSLLEHCDNWEKSVDASLKQRDLENRLVKTELAKGNLLRNEEKERFLLEKKELLKVISMMREQQSKIEAQEARLRSDLSQYAGKYDQCQTAISSGLSKFQLESRKMLKQLEKSKQDYVALLGKYESSNKRIAQLLEEKQRYERDNKVNGKKIDALERLCRALKSGEVCSCGSSKKQATPTDSSQGKTSGSA